MNEQYLQIAHHQDVLRDISKIKTHFSLEIPLPLKTKEGEDLHWKITRQIQAVVDHNIEEFKTAQNGKISRLKQMVFQPQKDYAPAVMIIGFIVIVAGVLIRDFLL